MKKTMLGVIALVVTAAICGCNSSISPRSFASDCAAVRSRVTGAGGRLLEESQPQRRNQSWEASSSYEFTSNRSTTLAAVRGSLESEYQLVREADGELDFVRTDAGDSLYVTVQFTGTEKDKTRVVVQMKLLPS